MNTNEKLEKATQELATMESKSMTLENEYLAEIEKNPRYSLEVDPQNFYQMSDTQKSFVKQFVEFKSIATAAELCGLTFDEAKQYYLAYSSQQEIRRINLAMYHRQFASRLLTLDEIGGYLSSMLTGVNVAVADRLKAGDKLKVCQMLIDLNKLKLEALYNPNKIMDQDLDSQIKNLSVETIKDLIAQTKKKTIVTDKYQIIDEIKKEDEVFTPEEEAYLTTLPTEELLQLIEETKKEN